MLMVKIIEKYENVHIKFFDKDSHQKVKILDVKDKGSVEEIVVMHKDEIILIDTLNRLQITADIYKDSMDAIWKMIENYGYSEFLKGNLERIQLAYSKKIN